MKKYKFAINDDYSYSHFGTDGIIDFDANFNQDNPPIHHKFINNKWILDKNLLIKQVESNLKNKLDNLRDQLIYNETYLGTKNYDSYKSNIIKKIAENRSLLSALKTKTTNDLTKLL